MRCFRHIHTLTHKHRHTHIHTQPVFDKRRTLARHTQYTRTQMSDTLKPGQRFMVLFEERRKLQTKLDDLAVKYREVVQERDKLSGIVRS